MPPGERATQSVRADSRRDGRQRRGAVGADGLPAPACCQLRGWRDRDPGGFLGGRRWGAGVAASLAASTACIRVGSPASSRYRRSRGGPSRWRLTVPCSASRPVPATTHRGDYQRASAGAGGQITITGRTDGGDRTSNISCPPGNRTRTYGLLACRSSVMRGHDAERGSHGQPGSHRARRSGRFTATSCLHSREAASPARRAAVPLCRIPSARAPCRPHSAPRRLPLRTICGRRVGARPRLLRRERLRRGLLRR